MKAQRNARSAGFTLVELIVSLCAGLIVALGIMALSRESTRTFNEEMRGAAAEATLRTAVDRLRADLQRAAFMSTGNIMADNTIARAPSDPTNIVHIQGGMSGLLRLASINLIVGGSVTANTLALSAQQTPALNPDAFEVGGNMTTTEQFEVQAILPAGGNGCTQVLLSALSPAIYRIGMGTQAASDELRNVFQPVPAGMTTQFIVRLVDTTGHAQYLPTCKMAAAAGLQNGFTQPYVWVDTPSDQFGIQYASQTGTQSGVVGLCTGCMVNPVQIARWEITSSTQEQSSQPQFATALDNQVTSTGTAIDPAKYDLMRSYVDATGNVVPETSEIVAEYAVDLKVAFSVDNTTLGDTLPRITTLAFDDANNATWAPDVSKQTPPANVGPQRIRSVRVRVVTRAAQADRTVNVPVTNFGQQQFLYRYCIAPPCLAFGAQANDQSLHWARARTMTTEVSFPNQAKDFF
jgi:type II secretory pathway component PulJ